MKPNFLDLTNGKIQFKSNMIKDTNHKDSVIGNGRTTDNNNT